MNKFFLEVLHEEAIPEMSLSELLGGAGNGFDCCLITNCNSNNCYDKLSCKDKGAGCSQKN